MIMWDKVIMKKEDCVFDDTIENMYVLFNDDKSILYCFDMFLYLQRQEVNYFIPLSVTTNSGFTT